MKLYTYYHEDGSRIGSNTSEGARMILLLRLAECVSVAEIVHGTGYRTYWQYKIKSPAENS